MSNPKWQGIFPAVTTKFHADPLSEEDEQELHETEPAPAPPPAATTPRRAMSSPTAALSPLPAREAKRYRNSHPYIQATLDLHGLTKLEAYELVQHFIARNYRIARRHIVIITGKGRGGEGVLRAELPHWLNEPGLRPMLACMFHASERDGGSGVMHLILKNSSKDTGR